MTYPEAAPEYRPTGFAIEVGNENMEFRPLTVDDGTPTGAQISEVAGFKPAQQATVLHFLPDGELEDIRPTETVDLLHGDRRFIVVETDRSYRLTVNGERFDWPCRMISGAVVRRLGSVSPGDELLLKRADQADRLLEARDLVDLDKDGVEEFVSRKPSWKLNVQGVELTLHQPTVIVRKALQDAGFNPDQGWQIFLIVKGQPKKALTLTDTVDLRAPGIEKIRLTPSGVHNGEGAAPLRRQFAVLDVDQAHLNSLGRQWETVMDASRRWLLIHDFTVPDGYTTRSVVLALEIPAPYPNAQIDMFYTSPTLSLISGGVIPCTQTFEAICGTQFNRWSRHRGPQTPWNPATDNVMTHLALVESAIAKEVGL